MGHAGTHACLAGAALKQGSLLEGMLGKQVAVLHCAGGGRAASSDAERRRGTVHLASRVAAFLKSVCSPYRCIELREQLCWCCPGAAGCWDAACSDSRVPERFQSNTREHEQHNKRVPARRSCRRHRSLAAALASGGVAKMSCSGCLRATMSVLTCGLVRCKQSYDTDAVAPLLASPGPRRRQRRGAQHGSRRRRGRERPFSTRNILEQGHRDIGQVRVEGAGSPAASCLRLLTNSCSTQPSACPVNLVPVVASSLRPPLLLPCPHGRTTSCQMCWAKVGVGGVLQTAGVGMLVAACGWGWDACCCVRHAA